MNIAIQWSGIDLSVVADYVSGFELDGGVFQHRLDEFESFLVRNLAQAGQYHALLVGSELGSQELAQSLNLLLDGELDRIFLRRQPHAGADAQRAEVFLRRLAGDLQHIRQEFRVAGVAQCADSRGVNRRFLGGDRGSQGLSHPGIDESAANGEQSDAGAAGGIGHWL